MFGSTMKALNTLGEAGSALQSMGESFGTIAKPLAWTGFHVAGAYAAGHAIGDIVTPGELPLKITGFKLGFTATTALLNVWTNGMPRSILQIIRDSTTVVACGVLGYQKGSGEVFGPTAKKLLIYGPATLAVTTGGIKAFTDWSE